MAKLAALLLALCTAAPVSAQLDPAPRYLTIETWTIDDSIIHPDGTPEERLLAYARADLSAMIYGYEYRYVPSDNARQVSEVFHLDPISEIRWGASGLKTRDVAGEDGTLYGLFEYQLSEVERFWLERWSSVAIPDTGGTGRADLLDGVAGRNEAVRLAIRAAIRSHLQSLTRNKPRESAGRVVLTEPPRILTDSGEYVARVKIKIEVSEVLDYEAF